MTTTDLPDGTADLGVLEDPTASYRFIDSELRGWRAMYALERAARQRLMDDTQIMRAHFDAHVPQLVERSGGIWGVCCGTCSAIASDYVWPCRTPKGQSVPPDRLVDASRLAAAEDPTKTPINEKETP
jgi:hypothetical protein